MEEVLRKIKEVKNSGKKSLHLRRMGITKVPKEISELTELTELSLIGNELTDLPEELSNLKNLRRLHLSENQFEIIPQVLFNLPSLYHCCIRENRISQLPVDIGELIHISDLDLDQNQIKEIPLTEENIDIIENLSLWENPIVEPPLNILHQGKEAILDYVRKNGKVLIFTLNLPKEFTTPIKQYLLSFNDFVTAAKRGKIVLEVKSVDQGILVEVEAESKEDLTLFQDYMKEYVGFIRQNVDDLEINYEVELTPAKREFLKHQMKQEIQFLKMKCDNVEFKNKVLEDTVDVLKQVLIQGSGIRNQQINFDVKQLQAPVFNNNLSTNISIDIEKLRDELIELNNITSLDEDLRTELDQLTEDLKILSSKPKTEIKESGILDKIKNFRQLLPSWT